MFMLLNMDNEYVVNPKSHRRIKVGGIVYNRLIREGLLVAHVSTPVHQTNDLNEAFMATLDALDTWGQLDKWRLFQTIDGYKFDILFLVHAITTQLNQMKSNNPYPQYPSNPFTRKPLAICDMQKIKRELRANSLKPSAILGAFLDADKVMFSEDVGHVESMEWKLSCIAWFKKCKMRFVRNIEQFDAEDIRLIGYWDMSLEEVTNNELWAMIYVDDPVLALEFENVIIVQHERIPFVLPHSYYYK